MAGAVGQAHELQQLLGTRLGLGTRLTADEGGNHDVLDGRKLGQQLVELKHEAQVAVAEVAERPLRQGGSVDAIDTYRTAVGAVEGADDLQQGGLAGTAGANDAHHLAFVDVQVDALQHLKRAEALGDTFCVYHG